MYIEERRELTKEEVAEIRKSVRVRPEKIKAEHYGDQDLICLKLRSPEPLNTGTYRYLSAYWTPNNARPKFKICVISNGVGDGTADFYPSLKQALANF